MVLLHIKLNNVYSFNDFEADFTYPKKLVNSSLEGEYLKNFPKIRYKKVNVIMGQNGSGKTTFGKVILRTLLFIEKRESIHVTNIVTNKDKEANIDIDLINEKGFFVRFEIKINGDNVLMRFNRLSASKDDTYESLINKLDYDKKFDNYINALNKFSFKGWSFDFPSNEEHSNFIRANIPNVMKEKYRKILFFVLSTFDTSIVDVAISTELPNTYIITFNNGNVTQITDGEPLSGIKYFSSGTKLAVNVANTIFRIKNHVNGFYYVDEQFSYVNSGLEVDCLNIMANLLGDGEQLFFTTHNPEILALSYPNHTFNFLQKTIDENKITRIKLINASSLEKRNNVNIKNLYDNDFFNVAPDSNKLFEIEKD